MHEIDTTYVSIEQAEQSLAALERKIARLEDGTVEKTKRSSFRHLTPAPTPFYVMSSTPVALTPSILHAFIPTFADIGHRVLFVENKPEVNEMQINRNPDWRNGCPDHRRLVRCWPQRLRVRSVVSRAGPRAPQRVTMRPSRGIGRDRRLHRRASHARVQQRKAAAAKAPAPAAPTTPARPPHRPRNN